ncbi:MAG: MFS transporter [Phycisphaerales bacterium]|nr:MFS transporter [Phycisphaerales bacterium]
MMPPDKTDDSIPAHPVHDAYAALRNRNYQLFAGGWLPASIGLQMQNTALAWEIYERTQDPLALGLIGVFRALPTLALALPAGQIADRIDRKRVLIATQIGFAIAGAALTTGSIAWERGALGSGRGGLWMMFALIALTGCARVFNGPSRSSLLPQMLPGGASGLLFQNAVTWNASLFQLAAMLGPIAAGFLIHFVKAAWPVYVFMSVSCLWFAISAGFIRPHSPPPVNDGMWNAIRPRVLIPGMLEGARHVWREKTVFGAITLDLFAVLLGGATALMPVYAQDILHVGPVGLGALRAAPFVGAFIMAVFMAHRRPIEQAGRALLLSVAGFGAFTILFGVSTNFWLSLACLAILGAVDNISVVIRHLLVSVRTPDHLRGRVAAVNAVFIESSNELGGFESGLVAKFFGPVFSVVSGGIGTILVVIGTACWLPELRRLRGLYNAAEEAKKPSDK